MPRFCTCLVRVHKSMQGSLSRLVSTRNECDLSQGGGRERGEPGLMRSENLLSGSQYYNYFINDSLIIFLFTDEQRWLQLFVFVFSFPWSFFVPSAYITALPRNDSTYHKSIRFVGERILGIRMTKARFYKCVRLIARYPIRRKSCLINYLNNTSPWY